MKYFNFNNYGKKLEKEDFARYHGKIRVDENYKI
jgi:hypothetical protein